MKGENKKPLPLTDRQLDSKPLEESLPTAIEFWSLRCEACRNVAPVVSRMAEVFDGRLKVFKVNVDENPRVVAAFSVSFVPYLLVIKNGRSVASFAEEWTLEEVDKYLE